MKKRKNGDGKGRLIENLLGQEEKNPWKENIGRISFADFYSYLMEEI